MQDPGGGGARDICPRLHSLPPHTLLRARIAEAANRNEFQTVSYLFACAIHTKYANIIPHNI